MLETSIKGAPAQAERLGRLARVSIVSRERFLDQERLHFLETHFLEARRSRHGHVVRPRSLALICVPCDMSTARSMT